MSRIDSLLNNTIGHLVGILVGAFDKQGSRQQLCRSNFLSVRDKIGDSHKYF